MTQKLFVMTGNQIKGIPLQALPESAWTFLTGGEADEDSIQVLFERVPWLYRGVVARCLALSNMPFALHRGDEDGEEVDAESAFSFTLKLKRLLYTIEMHLILFGAAYVQKERNRLALKGLRTLYPPTITPVYDAGQGLKGFERKLGNTTFKLALDDLAYLWLVNHRAELGPGVGEAQVALEAAGMLRNINLWGARFFEQGAVMPTLISVPMGAQEADKERLRSWFKRKLTGKDKAFAVEAIEGEVTVTQLGYPPNDLATPELTDSKRQDIATALGVPQTLLFSDAANYATAQQDDLHFYDKTVVPRAEMIAEDLNEQIFSRYGLYLCPHRERMEIFQAQEGEKAYRLASLVGDHPIMTVNEAREMLDLEPLPDDDLNELEAPEDAGGSRGPSLPDEADNEMANEMRRWRTMATRRFKEGKPGKALAFESDAIPPGKAAAIRGQLEACTTALQVGQVFDAAREWQGYP